MTDILPQLAAIMGIPAPSLRSIAKLLGVPAPASPEDVAVLVAFTHVQSYTSPEIAMGILAGRKDVRAVSVINRAAVIFDEELVDLQSGEVISADLFTTIFEQHAIDAYEVAVHALENINAELSQAAPPQPPEAAGADQTASAAGSP